MNASESVHLPWYTRRRFVLGCLVFLAGVLVVEGYLAIFVRDNDFLVQRNFGRLFLAGTPELGGQNHYLPSRALVNGLTAWLPYRLDRSLHFTVVIGLLALTFVGWHRLANRQQPVDGRRAFAAAMLTLLLVGCYVQRDLDDCGQQALLLFFLTAAVYSLSIGSPAGSGFWLGLATVYKITPMLFFPFLLWKRQWRAAGWMAVFALLWSFAPVLYLGWEKTWDANRNWLAFSLRCLETPDPSLNPLEPPRHLNQGLSMAVARFVQDYPADHPLHLDHPAFVQTGWLDPAGTKHAIKIVLLTFAALLAWRFRRRLELPDQGAEFATEWASVTLLCAVLSPLCWLQHLALIVPCVFLWARAWLGGAAIPRWHWPVMGAFALIVLVVHREFVSATTYELLVSYKLHTLAALLAMLLVLSLPREKPSGAAADGLPLPRAA
jgi:hypothetical protein